MGGTIQLKTERLVLRKHVKEDADYLYTALGSDEAMYKYSGWNPYATRKMAEETIQEFIDNYDDEFFFGWAVVLDGRIIGTVGAYDYDPACSSIEIGISIDRRYWGQGYASEVLQKVLKYLTEDRSIRIVKAWCAKDNTGSRKAMEKCAMIMIGEEKGALSVNDKVFDKLNYEYSSLSK